MDFFYNLTKKYSEIIKKIFVICFMVIIIKEITPFKKAAINIIQFIEKELFPILSVRNIIYLYNIIREFAIYVAILCIGIFLLYYFFRPLLEKNSRKNSNGNFEESLSKYLDVNNSLNSKKGYLITGEWGSGKSYIVNKFFENHFKFSNRPIYRVSCFGLDTREAIMKEIEKQIEFNDNSLLNWTQHIPLIGLPIFSLLKKSYSIDNISTDAIFIFDDFERITPLGIDNNSSISFYNAQRISSPTSRGNSVRISEFEDIDKEFKKIQESFNKLVRERNKEAISINLQKYNVATGLINELIENNNVKVIIVCNTDIIGNNYMDKIFRGKLNCITYNKFADKVVIAEMFDNVLSNYVFVNEESKTLIMGIIPEILEDFDIIWTYYKNSNLRDINSLFQAFLDTLNIMEVKKKLCRETIISLFYSIYFVKISENNLIDIEKFSTGSNLLFSIKYYRKLSDYNIFKYSKLIKEARWFGHLLSSYWILNLSKPNNIEEILYEFKTYQYGDIENVLLNYGDIDLSEYNIDLFTEKHLVYIVELGEIENKFEEMNLLLEKVKSKFVDWIEHGMNKLEPNHIVFLKELNGRDSYSRNFVNNCFSIIYNSTSYLAKDENSGIVFDEYRRYISNK
ncbi:P-loop NTPase fold protein [Carnobacterium maltaromaticum]